jgi:hypothetical protein
MGNVFSEKPLKEVIRENQRVIKKSIRELEKEIRNLETNEKKLIADIKKTAKANQMVIFAPVQSTFLSVCYKFCYFRGQCELWRKI